MNKISWCKRQKKGIGLIDRKAHLSESYMKDAEESLDVCLDVKGKWKVISGYYACYNALYSILMKCGIRCEIHDCTISLMSFFDFSKEELSFMESLKGKRIQTQYYLRDLSEDWKKVKSFVGRCKEILLGLNDNKINEIRRKIDEA